MRISLKGGGGGERGGRFETLFGKVFFGRGFPSPNCVQGRHITGQYFFVVWVGKLKGMP